MSRSTRQRAAIRRVFLSAERPLLPREVLELAARDRAAPSIATVYRNIKALRATGWLKAVKLPGQGTRYELSGKEHHHFFECRDCHRLFEVRGCAYERSGAVPAGFRVDGHEVFIWGLCNTCNREPRSCSGRS